jgi:hypothetical protein
VSAPWKKCQDEMRKAQIIIVRGTIDRAELALSPPAEELGVTKGVSKLVSVEMEEVQPEERRATA